MGEFLGPGLWFFVGLAGLLAGGELLVRGASRLALEMRIQPVVVGLTVVAFGTSAPELAVMVQSCWSGQTDLAIGNVVGSNIANVLLILGASAVVTPLVVVSRLIQRDVPLMIVASVAMLLVCLDGNVGRWEGAALATALIAYLIWCVVESRREPLEVQAEFAAEYHDGASKSRQVWANVALIVAGLLVLIVGARWLVGSAVDIARLFGVSELIIGLTIVAVGTSLPEVVTSLMASLRGERDIAVGNVVGSNLFNIMAVLGISSAVAPGGIPVSDSALRFDIPVMIVASVACLPVFFSGHRVARWEGFLFLTYYTAYIVYLVLDAVGSDHTRSLNVLVLGFVAPLTAITLVLGVWRTWRGREQI